jgi:tetratricopeptide (TPR) repeat protein
MSSDSQQTDLSLVPAGRGELAHVPRANQLVVRGLADVKQVRLLKVSEVKPNDQHNAMLCYKRGIEWLRTDLEKAINEFTSALRIDPTFALAYYERGLALWDMSEVDKAIDDYDEAIRLNPKYVYAYISRGIAWSDKKQYEKAIDDYDKVIQIDPKYPLTYYNRGQTWLLRKHYDKAIKDFEEAVRLDPNFLVACGRCAMLLATCSDEMIRSGKRALEFASKACDLTDWKSGRELATLAAAYAEDGRFAQAVRYQAKALEDPDFAGEAGDECRRRLQLYNEGRPLREGT